MKTINEKSYAKINIGLNICGNRDDGYHDLDMIMVPIKLHDNIIFSQNKTRVTHVVIMDDFTMSHGDHNLISLALEKLEKKYPLPTKLSIYVHKNIPVQAGFGGGSSNAATTLVVVNKMFDLNISQDELYEIATSIGSDVPFFIDPKPVRCQGVGNKFTPIEIKNSYHVLLIKPKKGCSTKEVYKTYDEVEQHHPNIDAIVNSLATGDDAALAKELGNSLEKASIKLVPEIKTIKDELKEFGLSIVGMTGSGSGIYALSTDKRLIKKAFRHFMKKYEVEISKILK